MSNYVYKGLPLTPTTSMSLIKQHFCGKDAKRIDMINVIDDTHKKLGGVTDGCNIVANVKIALQTLETKGEAMKLPVKGFWRIFTVEQQSAHEENNYATDIGPTLPIHDAEDDDDIPYETIGNGKECVYLYWFPLYEEIAKLKGNTSWRCKLGRSAGNPTNRIYEQCGTGMPELPIIGLIIKTENSTKLERLMHDILKYRNKHIGDTIGKEWFMTSPNEVLSIYQFLLV
jgi:hypothetical protein